MSENTLRVLVVEDESEIREFLISQFADTGAISSGLPSGDQIIQTLESFRPNIILLDQMMPGKSGKEIIKEIRAHALYGETPIMIVTGLASESDKVQALEIGADDYVTKPFSVKELIARAHALVRRSHSTHRAQQNNLVVKDLIVDFSAHKVILRGEEIALTLTEYNILCDLIRQSGQVVTREKLREQTLGNSKLTDRTIDVHMASLRKKLADVGDTIETVRGVGFRMVL